MVIIRPWGEWGVDKFRLSVIPDISEGIWKSRVWLGMEYRWAVVEIIQVFQEGGLAINWECGTWLQETVLLEPWGLIVGFSIRAFSLVFGQCWAPSLCCPFLYTYFFSQTPPVFLIRRNAPHAFLYSQAICSPQLNQTRGIRSLFFGTLLETQKSQKWERRHQQRWSTGI